MNRAAVSRATSDRRCRRRRLWSTRHVGLRLSRPRPTPACSYPGEGLFRRQRCPALAVLTPVVLVAGEKLLDNPAIAIRVTEEHEPPRQAVLDVSDLDAGVA
jgi:hypothetical protein